MIRHADKDSAKIRDSEEASGPVLRPPKPHDADWQSRIEHAKRVREFSKKAREGKPATFQPSHSFPR